MRERITRRRMMVGTLASLGTVGYGIAQQTNKASASVDTNSLNIPDKEYTLVDGQIKTVNLSTELSYSWSANVDITRYEVSVAVGFTEESAQIIARKERDDMGMDSMSKTATLQADILNAADYEARMFEPAGDQSEVKLTAVVELLLFRGDELLQTARATDKATITVTNEAIDLSTTLTGSGEISLQSTSVS